MDEEFDLEEVVACSYVDPQSGFSTTTARSLHRHLQFATNVNTKVATMLSVSDEAFSQRHVYQGSFARRSNQLFSFQIIHLKKGDRTRSQLTFKRKSAPAETLSHIFKEDHKLKCKYAICSNDRYWTVLVYSGTSKSPRRLLVVDLDSVELVTELRLPWSIDGKDWRVYQVTEEDFIACYRDKEAKKRFLARFDLKSGELLATTPIDWQISDAIQVSDSLYVRSTEPAGLTQWDIEELAPTNKLTFPEELNIKSVLKISSLDHYLMVQCAVNGKLYSQVVLLMDKDLSKIYSALEVSETIAREYLLHSTVSSGSKLFCKWKGHDFLLLGFNQNTGNSSDLGNKFFLVCQVQKKLVPVVFQKRTMIGDTQASLTCVECLFQKSKRVFGFKSRYHLNIPGQAMDRFRYGNNPCELAFRLRNYPKTFSDIERCDFSEDDITVLKLK